MHIWNILCTYYIYWLPLICWMLNAELASHSPETGDNQQSVVDLNVFHLKDNYSNFPEWADDPSPLKRLLYVQATDIQHSIPWTEQTNAELKDSKIDKSNRQAAKIYLFYEILCMVFVFQIARCHPKRKYMYSYRNIQKKTVTTKRKQNQTEQMQY